jgi:hypothetical protein
MQQKLLFDTEIAKRRKDIVSYVFTGVLPMLSNASRSNSLNL